MWIFGQVWFACLVGFAAGVLLDWVVRVRPLANRVVDLETRLDAEGRSVRAEAVASGASMFERGSYDPPGRFDSTGFDGDRSRGLLTPSMGGSLASDLLDRGEPDVEPEPETMISGSGSGVEDFPGVARLSGIWADEDAAAATSIAPAHGDAEWQQQPSPHEDVAATTNPHPWDQTDPDANDATPPTGTPIAPQNGDADQQYLDFLRAGGATSIAESHPETSGEVTSVLPYAVSDDNVDGYQSYEGYEEYAYNGNGHQQSDEDYQHDGYQIVDYQQEDLSEPPDPGTPLPHRDAGEFSRRYAPFEIPFAQLENSDVQPHAGELADFHPFQKSATTTTDQPDDGSSWFDMTDPGPGSIPPAEMTGRMLPIGRPGEEHPDLLGESVFGTESDIVYEDDEGHHRSLFEPVIAPDLVPDEWSPTPAPVEASLFDPTGGQGTTPRPIRVRTGVEPANGSSGGAHQLHEPPAGPFGPGSALPLADGAAPSADFRVKARTSSMVFHTESSPFYERLEPQVWFRDPKDAQQAGFTSWERPRSW